MPKSKQHAKRIDKLRRRKVKFESLISKRVKAFNELPKEEQLAILSNWKAKEETDD